MRKAHVQRKHSAAPVITLLVLSPLVVEFLFGSTHISMSYLLIPQIGIYGGAALIIRALAHQRSWWARLLLAIAFAVAEEGIILQTAVSPPYQQLLFGGAPNQNYLGALGINWAYLLWALAYESLWGILIPIRLTELIFPAQREQAWIGRRGLLVAALAFVIPSFGVWYTFTQAGIAPGLAYEAPFYLVLGAVAIMLALGAAALGVSPSQRQEQAVTRPAPKPWLVGLFAFLMSVPWFALAIFPYLLPASVPIILVVVAGLVWAAGSLLAISRWSSSGEWRDEHGMALIFGALVAGMLAGFLINGPALSPFDLVAKAALNLLAVMLLAYLSRRVRQRAAQASA
jgi:hypothetical protein